MNAESQVEIPVSYRGEPLGIGYRADLIVEGGLLVELKCVDKLMDIHLSQTITYLKLLNFKRALLINFNATLLKSGIRRVSI
jgi:GxxExxY protein